MPSTRKHLALVAIAAQRERLATDLIGAIEKRGCQIAECRIAPLGRQFSACLLLTGNWSALGKLESALAGLAESLDMRLLAEHTEMPAPAEDYRPYAAEVIAPQQNALIGEILGFFAAQDVRVVEINAQSYASGFTGADMSSINLALQVPLNQHPQTLREAFMDLCDDLHADGLLDPIKS